MSNLDAVCRLGFEQKWIFTILWHTGMSYFHSNGQCAANMT